MNDLTSPLLDIDRFDRIVWSVLLLLGGMIGLVLLRGDQVGLRVSGLTPAPNSTGVSTRTEIRLSFDETMDQINVEHRFGVTPPLSGTLSWRGKTLVWRPRAALTAGARYTVTLASGARSDQGRRLKDDLTWTFRTGQPRVVFMSTGDDAQLYAVETNGLVVHQLTHLQDGSSPWDYAVSPDGSQIVFGLVRADASAVDLWLVQSDGRDARLLLACKESQCSGATWSPDGRRLAYERRDLNVELGAVGVGPGPPRVWLLDLGSGQTRPLFQDSQRLGYAPRWSPDERYLGYFAPQEGVRVVDLGGNDSRLIPNAAGEMGTWSPDGQALVVVELSFAGERYASHLIRANLNDGSTHKLSGEKSQANDSAPAWSPDGAWIAFGRKALADGTPTAGQQLWLMRPDGSGAYALATDPEAHLGSIAWAPDGRSLAYLRHQLMQAHARPEIWWVSLDGSAPLKLTDNGTLPDWLP
jgi:TolB protein